MVFDVGTYKNEVVSAEIWLWGNTFGDDEGNKNNSCCKWWWFIILKKGDNI
jgi:hypothetical protein